jgi:hypothetical protein
MLFCLKISGFFDSKAMWIFPELFLNFLFEYSDSTGWRGRAAGYDEIKTKKFKSILKGFSRDFQA